MQYNLSIDRQVGVNSLLSVGYIGSLGRHLLTIHSANPGNPALCLSVSQPLQVAPGSPTCGPFGENLVFTLFESGFFAAIKRKGAGEGVGTDSCCAAGERGPERSGMRG